MRLLISGYRYFNDINIVESNIMGAIGDEKDVTIIHGGCNGVDQLADVIADKHNFKKEVYYADWSLGKRAGPIRNKKMIIDGKPTFAVLFLSKFSSGTKNMLNLINKYKIPHLVINI